MPRDPFGNATRLKSKNITAERSGGEKKSPSLVLYPGNTRIHGGAAVCPPAKFPCQFRYKTTFSHVGFIISFGFIGGNTGQLFH